MNRLEIFQVEAFTRNMFEGNPAGVVLGGQELETAQMQALARELNHSETAFVLEPQSDDHDAP